MRSGLVAAIFLMATSAIGPGFITQTATFTAQLGAAFAIDFRRQAPELFDARKKSGQHP